MPQSDLDVVADAMAEAQGPGDHQAQLFRATCCIWIIASRSRSVTRLQSRQVARTAASISHGS